MNKKNNLGKISIPFSLLSILLASCGKNTSIPEATYQKSKASFSLNAAPSANYEAQPDAQTIIIPESGCVILNSFANINNIKKQLTFENIDLYSSALENFRLNVKDQSLCHTTTLIPNKTDLAELVLKIGDEVSETFNIKVQSYPLPQIILNSFTKEVKNNIYNFSVNINNKNQPLNPKLYNIKFLSDKGSTIAFVPDESFEIRDYNNNKIGTVHNLDDGTTQFTIINSFDHQIHSIVIGHKFSFVANRYIINTKEKSLNHVNTDSFFTNEISTRESLFMKRIDALEKNFIEKLGESKTEITALKDTLSQELKNNLNSLNSLNYFFQQQINSIKSKLTETIQNLSALENHFKDFKDNTSPKIDNLEAQISDTRNQLNLINEKLSKFIFLSSQINSDFLNEVSLAVKNLSAIIKGTSTPILKPGIESLINEIKQSLIDSGAAKEEVEALKELNNVINSKFEVLTNKLTTLINNRIAYLLNKLSILDEKPYVTAIINATNGYNYKNINELIDAIRDLVNHNNIDSASPNHLTEEDLKSVKNIINDLKDLQDLLN
ncbi:MAG: hypothetical protein DCC88_06280 [Spirobacillus cienkowskii]|uniref:Uncharacterized protein n=1 Tax=Spirobacillus cienkowskii TaxID=495820 RepID=A0A369KWS4_9BACT|nr:MAG: hypothetical protein DCC88_06280 [Spirobacillus cienkowskii]